MTRRDADLPVVIRDAIQRGLWRDPGPTAWRQILTGVSDLPDLTLFTTPDLMNRVSGMLASGGYVDDPTFCMVRTKNDLSSASDPRLVFDRALFVAGSKVPGDDVFVVVDDATASDGRILVLDWNRPVPSRWVPAMTLGELCAAVATSTGNEKSV